MAVQQPPEPQPVGRDQPSTPSWLLLFYKWVANRIATFTSIFATVDFVVGTASSELGAERVATDTSSIDVDIGTAGQIKWNVLPAGVDHGGLAGLSDDDHPQYRLESADHSHQSTGAEGGQLDHGLALTGLTDDDHTQYYLVSAGRGMDGADFNRKAANPGDTDTLWMDDGTTYAAGTLVAPMPAVFLDEVSFGTPGFEQGSITVNGSTYDALVKVNEFGGTRDAAMILHRHHTTNAISAGLVFAKAATDDATHAAVADGERLGEIIAVGHDGTDYAQSSAIRFLVDGTPGSNDMPGAIVFLTAPDGSQTIAERFRVGPTGEWGIGGENYGTAGQVYTSGGAGAAPEWADAAGGGGGMTKDVTQASHGFSVQDVVYYTGSTYALADASAESTAEVVGIVSAVADADNFTITMGGHVTGLSGLTAGSVYFLSETAGDLTATEPTTTGAVSKPLLIADSTTSGYFFNMRGQVIGGGVAGVREITSGTATAGQTTLTVAYTPGYVDVYVNGVRLLDADFTATNGTSIVLDTGMALNDEWVVVVWTVTSTALLAAPTLPGGRLTLTSGTPVMSAEAAAQTTIYYTPYIGDLIPLYDGSAWAMKRFAEISIAMAGNAAWASGSVYDLYIYNDGGTIRLVTGAAWTNTTTRSESLTRVNGILTNTASMTGRYGTASTVTVAANRGTYVGTFYASANGTTTWELGGAAAGGDPGKLFLWNAYNRVPVDVCVTDTTNNWTYGVSATWRAYNNNTNNSVAAVFGLAEDGVFVHFAGVGLASSSGRAIVGVGIGSSTALASGAAYGQNGSTLLGPQIHARYSGVPGIGLRTIYGLEYTNDGSSAVTFYGDVGIDLSGSSLAGLSVKGMF